jgi:hypothetical protein
VKIVNIAINGMTVLVGVIMIAGRLKSDVQTPFIIIGHTMVNVKKGTRTTTVPILNASGGNFGGQNDNSREKLYTGN